MLKKRSVRIRHLFSLTAALLLAFCLATMQAYAAESGKLTLKYQYDNVKFRIYRAADTDGNWTESFKGSSVEIKNISTNDERRKASQRLAAYVSDKKITSELTGTITGGSVSFSGLESGIYLVIGDSSTSDGHTYTPIPVLVKVTETDATADVKFDQGGGTVIPVTPDKPDTPNHPNKPSRPSKPGKQTSHSKASKATNPNAVRTGDAAPLGLWATLFGASALTIGVLLRSKRRRD